MSILIRIFLTFEKIVVISVPKQGKLTFGNRTQDSSCSWWVVVGLVLAGRGHKVDSWFPGNVLYLNLRGGHIGIYTSHNLLGCTCKVYARHCMSVFTLSK